MIEAANDHIVEALFHQMCEMVGVSFFLSEIKGDFI